MKTILQSGLILLCSLLFLSCKKEDNNPASGDPSGGAVQPLTPGTATMNWSGLVPGGNQSHCALDRDSNIVLGIYWGTWGMVGCTSYELKICKPLAVGRVTLSYNSCAYVSYLSILGGGGTLAGTTQSDYGSGFINLTYLNFSTKTVSGTFEAHYRELDLSTRDLTNGTFTGTW